MLRCLWLIVAWTMFAGGATSLGLSAVLAGGRLWYGVKWPDHRVADLAEAGLVFWVLAGIARYLAGLSPARPEAVGDYQAGRDGAILDGRAEPRRCT